jgi:hypothetical protein
LFVVAAAVEVQRNFNTDRIQDESSRSGREFVEILGRGELKPGCLTARDAVPRQSQNPVDRHGRFAVVSPSAYMPPPVHHFVPPWLCRFRGS